MRGDQGARRRRAWTRPPLGRVFQRIGGSRTVVGCITRRGPRDAVDPQLVHCSGLRIRHSQPDPEHSVRMRERQSAGSRSVHHKELMAQRQDLKLQGSPIAH